jgi:chorismate mutase
MMFFGCQLQYRAVLSTLRRVNDELADIDRQIVRLLKDRVQITSLLEDVRESDVLDLWMEEAVDLDLDEPGVEKVFRAVTALCR